MDRVKKLLHCKAFYIVVAIIAVVAIILIVVVRKQQQRSERQEEKVVQVSVMEAGETGSDVTLTYTGLVQPDETTQCTFETVGTIEHVYVKKGDPVREGDILCTIEDDDAQDQLDSANRQLDYAKKSKDNAQESYDDALEDYIEACGTKKEKENLDDAIAKRDAQQEKVDSLKAQLDETPQYKQGSQGSMPETNTDYYSLKLQLDSAQSTLEAYQQNVDSAQEAYDKKAREGAESDDAKAQKERLDAAEETLDNANETYDNAADNVESAKKGVENCILRSPTNGYVVDVEATEGSVSTPIVPAVVVASNEVVINFGISQIDLMSVSVGMPVSIQIEGQDFTGSIKDIDVVPDESTRTYATNVTVDVANPDVYLGELATVRINIGERTGIWLPLSVVLNDGNDYVYVVDEGRAKRQYISIEEINNDQVLVTGTEAGELIICEGMKLIRTGSAVAYEGQE